MTDPINRPAHYCFSKIEPIDAIAEWGLSFDLGNVVKYVVRADHKGDALGDLRKAAAYLQHEIKRREAITETALEAKNDQHGRTEDSQGKISECRPLSGD